MSDEWFAAAACKGKPTALFFPERGGDHRSPKAVCRTCPVTAECLAYALANTEKSGVWGGKSERERRMIRSEQYLAMYDRTCRVCGTEFLTPYKNARYCSPECRLTADRESKRRIRLRGRAG